MDGSMMFVFYPGKSNNDLTVSVRSTSGHYPPKPPPEHPAVRVHRSFIDSQGYHHAEVICYSCDKWDENGVDVLSGQQRWIWAANGLQSTQTSDLNLPLQRHVDYNIMSMNMASSISFTNDRQFPLIQDSRGCHGAGDVTNMYTRSRKSSGVLILCHGLLLGGAFLVGFPAGVIAIRIGGNKAFVHHWLLQAISLTLALTGAMTGIWFSWSTPRFAHFDHPHQIAGLLIMSSLFIQVFLGICHHYKFQKTGTRSSVSHWHKLIGRISIAAGVINTGGGLYLKQAGIGAWAIVLLLVALDLTVLVIFTRNRSRSSDSGTSTASYLPVKGEHVVDDSVFTVADDKDIEEY
ncbi:uncharacterized protein BP5553_05516 [Venustampulla echinocandica]|uniref:Cytochrome b561 domain-containing protein n=1 Tax=Venustampulla echinocandica TaxID=2656787 RepID=A0A370TRE8_9HELO|nr:uncharacterized protein BP5553_05516 [Venustampulla echinocandica]RDL38083.1 hypothetical protein BP5553_05516 [Venustampulla echinocandica]